MRLRDRLVVASLLLVALATPALATPGAQDATFGQSGAVRIGLGGGAAFGKELAVQPDGRILVLAEDSVGRLGLGRYLADGTVDVSFGEAGRVMLARSGIALVAAGLLVQADGTIVAGVRGNGGSSWIHRLQSNGTPLAGVGANGVTQVEGPFSWSVSPVALLAGPSGSLYVAGRVGSGVRVCRYLADGTLDATYGGPSCTYAEPPGLSNVTGAIRQSGGQVVVLSTTFTGAPAYDRSHLLRFDANGALDATFGSGGATFVNVRDNNNEWPASIAIGPGDSILVSGTAFFQRTSPPLDSQQGDVFVFRLTADGALDAAFNGTGIVTFSFDESTAFTAQQEDRDGRVLVRADGRVLVAGTREFKFLGLAQFLADGTPDPAFGTGGRVVLDPASSPQALEFAASLRFAGDGSLLLAGTRVEGAVNSGFLASVTTAGALKGSFAGGGFSTLDLSDQAAAAKGVVVLPDNKVVVAGSTQAGASVARVTAAGARDVTFGTQGVTALPAGFVIATRRPLARQDDGKLVVAGLASNSSSPLFSVVRLNADGSYDTGFGTNGVATVDTGGTGAKAHAVAIQADGRIVVVGKSSFPTGTDFTIVRLLPTGAPDAGFGTGGVAVIRLKLASEAFDVVARPEGLYVGGRSKGAFSEAFTAIVRLAADGQLDATFANAGAVETSLGQDSFDQFQFVGFAVAGGGSIVALDAMSFRQGVAALSPFGTQAVANAFTRDDATGRLYLVGTDFFNRPLREARDATGFPDSYYGFGAATYGFASAGFSAATRAADGRLVAAGQADGSFLVARFEAEDVAPDAFAFAPASGVPLSRPVVSAPVPVGGFDVPLAVSVENGSYCVENDAPYQEPCDCMRYAPTSQPGTIYPSSGGVSYRVCAMHQSSASFSTAVTTTIHLGAVAAAFTSTTIAAADSPGPFTVPDVVGALPGVTVVSSPVAVTGVANGSTPVSLDGPGEFAIGCVPPWRTAATTVSNGQSVCVRLVSSQDSLAGVGTTLIIGGYADDYVVQTRQLDYVPDGGPALPTTTLARRNATAISAPFLVTGVDPHALVTPTSNGAVCVSSAANCACDLQAFTDQQVTADAGTYLCARVPTQAGVHQDSFMSLFFGPGPFYVGNFNFVATTRDDEASEFTIPAVIGQPLSTIVASAPFTVPGIDLARIAVTGGEYSIGCTATYTSEPGEIAAGQSVCVRHTTAATPFTDTVTQVTIGEAPIARTVPFLTRTAFASAALAFTPPSDAFGTLAVGAEAPARTYTLTNTGGAAVTVDSVTAQGDASVVSTTCATLAAGGTCTVTATIRPLGAGPRSGLILAAGAQATAQLVLTATGQTTDTTPNAFAFTDQFAVPMASTITSAPVQVTGLSGAATVSVANGSYCVSASASCGGCTFRQDPSSVTNGQYLCARHTSSPVPGGQVDTLVFVGGLGDAFTSIAIDTVPANFTFTPVTRAPVASAQVSGAAAIVGINAPAPVSVTGGEYSVGCTGSFTSAPGTVSNGQTVCVRHLASSGYGTATSTTLNVGGVTGSFVSTTLPATSIPRLANISTRMQVLTGNDVLIGGFIIGGAEPKTVVVRARGPSLIPFGVANALANPRMDLYSGQTVIASNDDWGSATNASAIQASGFAPSNAQESAILTTLAPGAYTAVVSGTGNATGVGIIEVFEVDRAEIPLLNISTRGQVLTGGDVMIGGFIIQGEQPQTVVIRARGPSLAPFGITNALQDPVLQLFAGQTVIASNDDWQASADAAVIQSSGFAPADAREAVIRVTLPPGAYTAIVSGKNGGTGVGIVEVFAQ